MISIDEFKKIESDVVTSIEEMFDFIQLKALEHDYTIYLADGELRTEYHRAFTRLNPYIIENRLDKRKDTSRLNFFIKFMRTFYSFPKGVTSIPKDEYRITMELMIYSHVWESKPFLKRLYRLARLASGDSYQWSVNVPEMSKHIFIREEIRDVMNGKELKIGNVISKGFHTSLRNAFAHSEYTIDIDNNIIYLDTFKGKAWDIKQIALNDWTQRFAYTALLSYHLESILARRKADWGESKPRFLIIHPITSEKHFTSRYLYYDGMRKSFTFNKRN